MKVLVTGANGFLGRHIVAELLGTGHTPRAMIQPGTDASCFAGSPVELAEADLADADSLARAVAGADAVIHLAALVQEWGKREWFEEVNVRGTAHLLDSAAKGRVQKFVFMSSLAVHGAGDFVDGDESAPRNDGGNPYAWSKIRCEDLVAEAHGKGGLAAVIIRPGLIPYGEWDVRGFGALAAALTAGPMPVAGDPDNLTCTVYAPNLARGVRLALEAPPRNCHQTYVLTDGLENSWRHYFSAMADSLGVRLRLLPIPGVLARLAGSAAEGAWKSLKLGGRPPVTRYLAALMSRSTHFSSALAAEQLDYAPPHTFAEGMARTAEWWLSTPST